MSNADRLAHKWVKDVLRSEMIKRGVTFDDLAGRLVDAGVVEGAGALRNRISRARFSAAFFFQCLAVMGARNVNVELYDYIRDEKHVAGKSHPSRRFGKNSEQRRNLGPPPNDANDDCVQE